MFIEKCDGRYVATYQPKTDCGIHHISELLPAIGEGKTYGEAIGQAFSDMIENRRAFSEQNFESYE
jgi:hypothetical protein